MILILLAAFGQGRPQAQNRKPIGPPPAIVQALGTYIRNAKSLSAELTLTAEGVKDVGTVRMVYEKPDKFFYSIKWAGLDYEYVGTDKGSWDADLGSKTYDDFSEWRWSYPESLLSEAPYIFMPGFLMDGTLHSERIANLAVGGHETINGVEADEIVDASGLQKAALYVDHDGKPLRAIVYRKHLGKVMADVKSLVINTSEPESLFTNNPPIGFKALSVRLTPRPVGIGDKFPVEGWKSSGLSDLFAQKPTLVLVTEEGCEPSAKTAPALSAIGKSGSLGVAVVSISANGGAPAALSAFPKFYDSSGKLEKQIDAPATPLFYLVGKDGKIVKVWMGFDPDKAADFEQDVADSAK